MCRSIFLNWDRRRNAGTQSEACPFRTLDRREPAISGGSEQGSPLRPIPVKLHPAAVPDGAASSWIAMTSCVGVKIRQRLRRYGTLVPCFSDLIEELCSPPTLRDRPMAKLTPLVTLVTLLFALAILAGTRAAAEDMAMSFVGRPVCASCHAVEAASWEGSDHAAAMQVATESTVLGNFEDASIDHFGITSTFYRKDEKFFVRTDGPDGSLQEYQIAYTFGVFPLQQYLIAFPGGRLQALGIAWDSRPAAEGGQRWFHLYPDQAVPFSDPLHWTKRNQTWNFMCADCHSTNLRKNYDLATDSYATTWSEIDVSCEACHGPGSAHVAWAQSQSPDCRRSAQGFRGPPECRNPRTLGTRARRRHRDPHGAAPVGGGDRHLCSLPCTPTRDRDRIRVRPSVSGHPRADPAGRWHVSCGRADSGRGLRIRLVPAKPHVPKGRDLLELP